MKISLLLVLFILLFAFISCNYTSAGILAHSKPYADKFADRIDEGSGHLRSTYYTSWERTADGHYVFKQYYTPHNTLTDYISYSKPIRDPKYLDGPSKRWYDDGRLRWEHYYENGKKLPEWKEWSYETGMLESESKFDSTLGMYIVTRYDEDGLPVEKKSRLSEAGETTETLPAFYAPECRGMEGKAFQQCSDRALLTALYKNIRYPATARNAMQQGTAVIRFAIEPDGSISNIQVIRGISEPIAQECRRVVETLDRWKPGTQNGEPVRVQFTMPIKFRLQ